MTPDLFPPNVNATEKSTIAGSRIRWDWRFIICCSRRQSVGQFLNIRIAEIMGTLLDAALKRAFSNRTERIRFIQIGGNDGVFQDPLHDHRALGTYEFEWGHIYEPIPEYFSKLVENTKPFPFITCHPSAVDTADVPGTRSLNYVSPSDIERHGLPQSSQGQFLPSPCCALLSAGLGSVTSAITNVDRPRVEYDSVAYEYDRGVSANRCLAEGFDQSGPVLARRGPRRRRCRR